MNNQPSELGILSLQAVQHRIRWMGERNRLLVVNDIENKSIDLLILLIKIDKQELNAESSSTVYELGMILAELLFHLLTVSAISKIDIKAAYDQFLAKQEQEFRSA